MLSTDWFGVRHSKPAHKRSLFLIFGKKLTFVRGFRTEEGLGFYVGGGVDACGCAARAPLRRLLAPCALCRKTLRVSQASRPLGFESLTRGTNKNSPVVGAVSKSMVGDEGFEPRALCV